MAPSLVRKHRESHSFLRLRRESKVVAGAHSHFQRRQFFSNHSHQGQIICSSTGNHEFAKTHRRLDQWQHKLGHGDADGSGGKRSCGGDDVMLVSAATKSQKLAHELAAKLLATGGLRGFLPEEWIPKQLLQHSLDGFTARGNSSIAIKGALEQVLADGIDHHVAGASVEGNYSFGKRSRRNRGEISDASEVLHDSPVTAMAVERVIEKRRQRCAFTACGHVCRAEIRDHWYTYLRRDNGRFATLPGAGNAAPQEERRTTLMVECLPVAANEFAVQARAPLGSTDRVCIQFTKQEVQSREIGDARRACVHGCEDGSPNIDRIRKLVVCQQFETGAEAAPLDTHQRDVDSVSRGAAHYSRDDQSTSARACIRTSSLNSQRLRRSLPTALRVGATGSRDFSAR